MAVVVARALYDDPAMAFMVPDERVRERRLPDVCEVILRRSLPAGVSAVAADGDRVVGVAAWEPTGTPTSWWRELNTSIDYLLALRGRVGPAAAFGQALQNAHPRQPHWYLSVLGTDPAAQGRGVGTALVSYGLAHCDAARMPAYLETNTERNVRYYERFGFEVSQEIEVPSGGPRTWAMWRDVR